MLSAGSWAVAGSGSRVRPLDILVAGPSCQAVTATPVSHPPLSG